MKVGEAQQNKKLPIKLFFVVFGGMVLLFNLNAGMEGHGIMINDVIASLVVALFLAAMSYYSWGVNEKLSNEKKEVPA